MSYNRTPNTVLAGRGLKQSPSQAGVVPPGVVTVTVDSDIATTTSLGVVQIGNNISITPDGVISVADPSPAHNCTTKTVNASYTVLPTDYYVGVISPVGSPTTITLPDSPADCLTFIIKAEMSAPMGSRKITIVPQGIATIDGAASYVISVPYESVTIMSNGGHWWII